MPPIKFRREYKSREHRGITPRRLKNSEKALQKERDKFPLLADWIAEQQPTPEERLSEIDQRAREATRGMRKATAETWRESRQRLRTLPPDLAEEIVHTWNNSLYPKNACYFAEHINQKIRQIDPEAFERYRDDLLAKLLAEHRKQVLCKH